MGQLGLSSIETVFGRMNCQMKGMMCSVHAAKQCEVMVGVPLRDF